MNQFYTNRVTVCLLFENLEHDDEMINMKDDEKRRRRNKDSQDKNKRFGLFDKSQVTISPFDRSC